MNINEKHKKISPTLMSFDPESVAVKYMESKPQNNDEMMNKLVLICNN